MEMLTVAAVACRNLLGQKDASIAAMRGWVAAARQKGADLVLFPELNVSGYITAPVVRDLAEEVPGPIIEKVTAIARDFDCTIAFGMLEKESEALYCAHVLVNAQGLLGRQRKVHVPGQEQPYWKAGNLIEVFDIGKARVGVCICRDAFFDEMTRTLYFKGAEVVLMPFGYYNVPRVRYLQDTIHGMSLIKASWSNGFYAVVCNSAEERSPNVWEPQGRKFPGWAGVFSPWGRVLSFVTDEGNSEAMVIETLDPQELNDRRSHINFLAEELRPELYQFHHTAG